MYRLIFLLFSVGCFTIANAAEKAGSVVLSVGTNTAQMEGAEVRKLKRQSSVYTTDTISTGAKSVLQLRFTDGSRLSLREESLFEVAEYRFDRDKPEKGRSVYKLLKGGLRTITGAISDADTTNYSVQTPIATIGVRGTHYSLFYCDRTCNETTRAKVGLYGYVLEGAIVVGTDSVGAPIQAGHFFFLGGNGSSLQISKKPFELFELIGDEGVDLMGNTNSPDIPALNEIRSPVLDIPRGQGGPTNYP
ncbi:FecR family protein [Neptuniibacter caesariensis]|uniref:FecR protein domain-containing protein n=1 Tax=Neptuniibacter caesariensis TaxID=207954 RepID=A0A7U8GTJ9_NEPCE|nr:FecR family protein [Neptuniibacter caesariensis]EAR62377.1 hypothetical protein MED92_15108 [Oceanospirillum sp. MED92] [Neptuniibacter caesariensis]